MVIWRFIVLKMVIDNIKLKNFRNYLNIDLSLGKNMNIFIGNNAQGKTNILESICILALTKTYKSGLEQNIISFEKDKAKITGKVKQGKIVKTMEIIVDKELKKMKINKKEVRKASEYISNLNIIVFTPEDLNIIKGSPSTRRNLINIELSQISIKYLNTYNEYNKILKMRNEYLKLLLTSSIADRKYLDIITDKLIEKAIIIYEYRKKYLDDINIMISDIYKSIMKEGNILVRYESSIEFKNFTKEEIKEKMIKVYRDNYKKELGSGMTLYGPHRDDISFYLNDKNLKFFGSEGQQKMAILSFKLSEIEIFKKETKYYPILLLDDIFSEFDIEKRNKLLEYVKENIQSIITTTDLKNIKKKYISSANIYEIKNGSIERRQ